jgi:hypothetical protein
VIASALLALSPAACKRQPKPRVASIPAFVSLASVVNMNDPHAAEQLLSGFYQVEDHNWRWVAPKFAVALRPKGTRLTLKFNLPDALLKQGPVTLSAALGQHPLPPETYTVAGNQTFVRDISASEASNDVIVNFTCDKTMPPAAGDVRTLALIVVSVGLDLK